MVDFIDQHRDELGVEPICKLLPIAPSTYYRCKQLAGNPEMRCARYHRDEELKPEITRVWEENLQVYGARKVWKQLTLINFGSLILPMWLHGRALSM
jgi:hypothetical protein